MKVLITGAGGQLAHALLQTKPAGIDVQAFARSELDITSRESVVATISDVQPDVIVNAAAYTAVDRAESEPDTCNKVNADGARLLAVGAREHGARLLQVSTDYVFDGATSVPYHPDAIPHPLGVYGESKRRGEQLVLEALGDRAIVLRTAWVYAAWGSNFVRKMLQLMAERHVVSVVADQVGSPTSARSVAQVLWRLVGGTELHGIYHWTDAGVASWYDLAVAIAEEGRAFKLVSAGIDVKPISTSEYPTPARRPHYSVLDTHLTRVALEMRPKHWRDNLRETLKEIAGG
jgi:dTDP-4-dehydrorhamnose reductase